MTDDDSNPASAGGFDRLRAANPVPPGTSFDPFDARARAILEEVTTMDTTNTTEPARTPTPLPFWKRPAIIGAAAALALIAGIGVAMTADGSDDNPDEAALPIDQDGDVGAVDGDLFPNGEESSGIAPGEDGSGEIQMTSCAVSYSPEELRQREYAFEGTITAVAEDGATTFSVSRWFSDGTAAEVTLDGSAQVGSLLSPDVGWEPGAPVLVSGDEGFVWGCGFTTLAESFSIQDWEAAFAG